MKADILSIAVAMAALVSGHVLADETAGERPEREHGRPPKVAVEACAAAVPGDACSFEGRQGEQLDGSCFAPEGKPLACRPNDMSPPAQLDPR